MRTRVEQLFYEVSDLTRQARARHFDARAVNVATRREVEALLEFDSESSASLDRDISTIAQSALAELGTSNERCGAYRLGGLLGRGGMGAVYSAERVDGEVTQRAAIKLLRSGADDPQIRRRFLAERQILATLSHSNIARLLDAGHRDDGQPYLVMEYVDGQTIDAYAAGLGIRQKIDLFIKVCAAVAYLHRNLVVHRDLKPSNILVTPEGEPKLLDFGIAKMLDVATDSTVTGMRMLTPDYASPEQVAGGRVTTATDIYSLGAVLYKLLTGVSPHKFGGDPEAISATILNGKIDPPSKVAPGLHVDLDMIIMKALRKEPQERYATIEQFSDDLENYIESRPIRARRGEGWYHTLKFLRRSWLPVSAVAVAILGLSSGLVLANRERLVAERRFLDVRQLANKLFDIDWEARKFTGSTKTRQLIVDTALEYLKRLSADAGEDSQLALEVGNAYMRVARVQGVPISPNLGQMDQAERNLRTADEFVRRALRSQPANRTALLRMAQISHDRMLLARLNSRRDDALRLARESAGWLERFHAGSNDAGDANAILLTYLNVADQYSLGRQFEDALRLSRRGSELARFYNNDAYLGTFLWVSGEVFRHQGKLDQALQDSRKSVSVLQHGSDDSDQGISMNYVLALIREGRILGEDNSISLERRPEAVEILQRAFDLADRFVHLDSHDQSARGRLAMAGIALGDIVRHSDSRRALDIYDHTFRHVAEIPDNPSFRRFEASALAGSSYALRGLGRSDEARQRLDDAFERLKQVKSYPGEKVKPHSETDLTMRAFGDYQAGIGDVTGAIETYEKLLGQILKCEPKTDVFLSDAFDVSQLYAELAALHWRAGHAGRAAELETERLDLWRHWDLRFPHNAFVRRQLNLAAESRTRHAGRQAVQLIGPHSDESPRG